MVQVLGVAGDDRGIVGAGRQDDAGVDHVRRVRPPTEGPGRLGGGLVEDGDLDALRADQGRQARLTRAVPPGG